MTPTVFTPDPEPGSAPVRTCVGCRTSAAQGRLLRFMRRDDGQVVPANVTRDVHGRSAYACAKRSCLEQAVKRRAFTRAFGTSRHPVSVIDVDIDALSLATLQQLRCEIELLQRTAWRTTVNPHTHPRRRGLEQLLSELSSQPQTPERSASTRGRKSQTTPATPTPATGRGGAPSHG